MTACLAGSKRCKQCPVPARPEVCSPVLSGRCDAKGCISHDPSLPAQVPSHPPLGQQEPVRQCRCCSCSCKRCCSGSAKTQQPGRDALCAGFAYLPKATHTFLAQACEQGAQVHYNSPVLSLQRGPSERVASRSSSAASPHPSKKTLQALLNASKPPTRPCLLVYLCVMPLSPDQCTMRTPQAESCPGCEQPTAMAPDGTLLVDWGASVPHPVAPLCLSCYRSQAKAGMLAMEGLVPCCCCCAPDGRQPGWDPLPFPGAAGHPADS